MRRTRRRPVPAALLAALSFVGGGVWEWGGASAAGATIAITGVAASPASVPRYAKVELTVALSGVAATKPYDPDPAAGGLDLSATFTSPTGVAWNIKGFYTGASWLVRFAPNEVGAWAYAVVARDPSGTSNTATGGFACVASSLRGWPRIDGRLLRFPDGQVLFGVGHNTGWQTDVEQPSLASMAAQGENLLSFWLATPWAQPSWASAGEPWWDDRAPIENTEQGIGNYNQAACAYLDAVVARAEAAGICLLPTLWSHGQLRNANHPWGEGWWYNNAYSALCAATAFFKTTAAGGADTPQWRFQKNLYRYVLARWGYSRAIAAWVVVCEVEGTTGYHQNPAQAEAWCLAVRDFFRANDPFRRNASGRAPYGSSKTDGASPGAPSWDGGFDLRTCDSYLSQADDIGVAATLATETQTMRASGKPCFHAELGGSVTGGATQPTHLHNGIWAGAAAGAAIAPLVWCDGGSFPMLTPAMRDHLQYLAQFMGSIDYLGDATLASAAVGVSDPACRGWGMMLPDRGYAWVQRTTAGGLGGQVVSIAGVAPGQYAVSWFDVWVSGAAPIRTDPVIVGADRVLRGVIPVLARGDVALKFAGAGGGNTPPTANDDTVTTPQDSPVAVNVLANDTDLDGDPLTVTGVTDGANGAAALNPDQTVTYTPGPGFTGSDIFTYTISDGRGGADVAFVHVTVNPPGAAAVLTIAMSTKVYASSWKAVAKVTVRTPSGAAITGATVTGHWSGVPAGAASGSTNFRGKARLTSGRIRVRGTATFTVDSVVANGTAYALAGETSDSVTGAPRSRWR